MCDGFKEEKRPIEWIGVILHWCWLIPVLSMAENPYITYAALHIFQGLLSWTLISNHYLKDWAEVGELKDQCFPERQMEVNTNIRSHPFFDWFFVGLHFHNEHHAFPKMPRQNLRFVSKDLRVFLERHNIEYETDHLWVIMKKVAIHMHKLGQAYGKRLE